MSHEMERYWIYPGERRSIIVKASSREEAEGKVRKSPLYDGFGGRIYAIEEFAERCERGEAT